MRVAINCRSFLKPKPAGIGRYASNLVMNLARFDKENQYFLYCPKRLLDFKRRLVRVQQKNFKTCPDYFNRGVLKTTGDVDIYHAPSPEVIAPMAGVKTVVTVHDLIAKTFPESHTPETRDIFEKEMESILRYADHVICISRSTLTDLKRYYSIPESRLSLVEQGVDHDSFYVLSDQDKEKAGAHLRQKGIKGPFLLFVGTIEPRKNLKNLLKSFVVLKEKNIFPGQLVIAGMKGWMSEDLGELTKHPLVEKHLVQLGYITNAELRSLYNLCEVFVFPSLYEGFGFPIVEAFACGAAVVTSNVSSCAEVAKDAALTVDPNSPQEIADAIGRITQEAQLKKDLQTKALARARDFSFEKTARETLAVYKKTLLH